MYEPRFRRPPLASVRNKNFQRNFEDTPKEDESVCNTISETYKEFAAISTVHGLKYTVHVKSTWGKIFWTLVIILSVISATQLAQKFYIRHKAANMRTLVISNQYPSWYFSFPAITYCHSTIASLHRIEEALTTGTIRWPKDYTLQDLIKNLVFLREALIPTNRYPNQTQRLQRFLNANNFSLLELFKIVSLPCEDFIVLCRFEMEITPCEELLTSTLTPYGLCCSYNYARYNGEERYSYNLLIFTTQMLIQYSLTYLLPHRYKNLPEFRSPDFGMDFTLSVLVKSYPKEDRLSFSMFGQGTKIIIHERNTYPGPSAQEFVAGFRQEVIGAFKGTQLIVSQEIRDLPVEERDCCMSKPDSLYRADNCYVKCREKIIRNYCDCVPFYASIIYSNDTICNLTHVPCLVEHKSKYEDLNFRDKQCGCKPDCEGTTFKVSTSSLDFIAAEHNPADFYQTSLEYKNPTAIHIGYASLTFMLQSRELVLSWINLVSSLGDVFSLFLGCSFVSIFEFFYYLGYLMWKLTRKKKPKAQVHPLSP
ncbi:sodium channel protein Nach-like [Cotesia typhae]|uniref:sodium channel protein Nach-like n=1 Tax=Cotesia typhae TaxID=2053667 RepID=UPI003D68D686